MDKKKNIFIAIGIIIVIIAIGAIIFWSQNSTNNSNASDKGVILYYGNTCPHCKLVEDFISQNGIAQKVSFENKEVYQNQNNAIELGEKAQKCSLATDSIGVPFLWDGSTSKCLVGDQAIIQFFKDKAGIK